MMYLTEFGLSEKDIKDIYDSLGEEERFMFMSATSDVEEILNYFKELGFTNLKELLLEKPLLFCRKPYAIRELIEKSDVPGLVDKLKEDIDNFKLIGY